MKISTAFPSNYIKSADLEGRPVKVKMNMVKMEEIGDDTKPVLYFIGKEKGMVLNKTNANVISMIFGDDTDGWAGGEIEIFPTETDFQGKRVQALRVRMATRQVDEDRVAPNARTRAAAKNAMPEERFAPLPASADEYDDPIPF